MDCPRTVQHMPDAVLWMIRHAATDEPGRLLGRQDVTIRIDPAAAAELRRRIGPVDRIAVSPALRCRQTAAALWPDRDAVQDQRLWEQDFGAWEGAEFAHLPQLGPLTPSELAGLVPPGGESFVQAADRILPAIEALAALGGSSAVVAHAGTVRAALARVLDDPAAALAVPVPPLSAIRIQVTAAGWRAPLVGPPSGDPLPGGAAARG